FYDAWDSRSTAAYSLATLSAIWRAMLTAAPPAGLVAHAATSTTTLLLAVSARWQAQPLPSCRVSVVLRTPLVLSIAPMVKILSGPPGDKTWYSWLAHSGQNWADALKKFAAPLASGKNTTA